MEKIWEWADSIVYVDKNKKYVLKVYDKLTKKELLEYHSLHNSIDDFEFEIFERKTKYKVKFLKLPIKLKTISKIKSKILNLLLWKFNKITITKIPYIEWITLLEKWYIWDIYQSSKVIFKITKHIRKKIPQYSLSDLSEMNIKIIKIDKNEVELIVTDIGGSIEKILKFNNKKNGKKR